MHEPRVVTRARPRCSTARPDAARRLELVGALSRLANQEAPWNGTWWATRPSTVGPYFDPEAVGGNAGGDRGADAALNKATATEIVALGRELQRNGASAGAAVSKFLAFADKEPALIPQITAYFADGRDDPGRGRCPCFAAR